MRLIINVTYCKIGLHVTKLSFYNVIFIMSERGQYDEIFEIAIKQN